MSALPTRTLVLLCAAGAVALGLQYGACTQDDAFISLRYADNLVRGLGLVYNAGERVEGFTNLSWTLLLAGALRLGFDPVVATTALGLLALGAVVLATGRLADARVGGGTAMVAAVLLAVDGQLALEAVEGLETVAFAAGVTMGLAAAVRDRGGIGSSAWFALAALTRPEGVLVWGAVQVGLGLDAVAGPEPYRAVKTQVGRSLWGGWPLFFTLAGLTAFRLAYYGDPLPNTFYAKTGGLALARGLTYLQAHMMARPLLWGLVAARIFLGQRSARTLPMVGLVAVYLAYVVAVGGDFKPTGRFVVPVLPALAVLAAESAILLWARVRTPGRSALVVVGLVGLFPYLAMFRAAEGVARDRHANLEARKLVGDWLATHTPPDTVLAIHSAGVIPFYADRTAIDMWGLTDRNIARSDAPTFGTGMAGHEKADPGYVFGRNPEIYLPEDRVFTLKPWILEPEQGFPEDFAARYRPVTVPIEGRWLQMWVRRDLDWASGLGVVPEAQGLPTPQTPPTPPR